MSSRRENRVRRTMIATLEGEPPNYPVRFRNCRERATRPYSVRSAAASDVRDNA